jgi:hypothetical protein
VEFLENQLILNEVAVDNGPYMQAKFASLINADCTDQADKVLGEDFRHYLDEYFVEWQLTRAVELFPARESRHGGSPPFKVVIAPYKIVRHILELPTHADAETVRRHLQGTTYPFHLRYRRV